MKQNYIIYNGKRYNSGDTIHILWYAHGYKNLEKRTGVFIDCDEEKDEYRFMVGDIEHCFNKKMFFNTIIDESRQNVDNSTQKREPRKATMEEELSIDGMLLAWVWYIFIMCIAVIFYDCIGIWILASVVFFSYRRRKLNERGYK